MAKKKKVSKKRKLPAFALGKIFMDKDPRVYAAKLTDKAVDSKRVVGIDLGSNCGVSFCDFNKKTGVRQILVMGQWDLNLGPHDTGPMRFIRMKQYLTILQPDLVMYEDVKYTPSKDSVGGGGISAIVARVAKASELLGGLKVILTAWCEERGIPAEGLSIAHIKKYATGKGNAGKELMIEAANEQFGTDFDPATYQNTGVDNIVDSAFCCKMGVDLYSEGLSDE